MNIKVVLFCLVIFCYIQHGSARRKFKTFWMSMSEANYGNFKKKNNKNYANEYFDKESKENYLEMSDIVHKHNQKFINGKSSFYLDIQKYADLEPEDFRAKRLGYNRISGQVYLDKFIKKEYKGTVADDISKKYPASFDWRANGCDSPVKDQAECSASWAFAINGALECGVKLQLNLSSIPDFSEQQLIDCVNPTFDCRNGGDVTSVLDYLKNKAVANEEDYAYTQRKGTCYSLPVKEDYIITDFDGYSSLNYVPNEDQMLKDLVNHGPLIVTLTVNGPNFRSYEGGIFSDDEYKNTGEPNNHAALLVGYDSNSRKEPFWIVKNSWGKAWGRSGYMKIKRGVGMCNIGSEYFYLKVKENPRSK